MSGDPLSKIRAGDVYKQIVRVLNEFRIERHSVVDKRPHPYAVFSFGGVEHKFHFAGTPSSKRTPATTAAKLRRYLRNIEMTQLPQSVLSAEPELPIVTATVDEPAREPVVFVKDGAVFATSRDVAEFFEKRHDHVLRDIDNLIAAEPGLRLPKFGETVVERQNPSGGAAIASRAYQMNRDGFTLLAMGFTGAKALKWKLRYIEAFNTMEEQLRRQTAVPALPADVMELLRRVDGIARMLSHKVTESERSIEDVKADLAAIRMTPVAPTFDWSGTKTAYQIIEIAGISLSERQRGTTQMITNRMLEYCSERGQLCWRTPSDMNPARPWRFPMESVHEWLFGDALGAEIIRSQINRQRARGGRSGQASLSLVSV